LWIRKCDAELKELNADAPAAASSSSSSSSSSASASASAAVSVAPAAAAAARSLADQMKPHSWLQSASHVNLTVWAKNVAADAVSVEFASAHDVDVRVAFPDGSHYRRRFELARAIVVAESSFRATAYKIEITLRKDDAAAAAAASDARPEWPALERTEAAAVAAAVSGAKHVAVAARASRIVDILYYMIDARSHSPSIYLSVLIPWVALFSDNSLLCPCRTRVSILTVPALSAIASCIPYLPSPFCHCPAADKPLAYPTSAKTKRDWTAVGKEVQQEEADEKPQGEVRALSDKVSLSLSLCFAMRSCFDLSSSFLAMRTNHSSVFIFVLWYRHCCHHRYPDHYSTRPSECIYLCLLHCQDALNKLLKDIFAKGSDETKRAMAKSIQTSGGTVLSTNWNEVKEKDYEKEITAPKGQEVKRWGSE
jgi:hypothetical protein